MPSIGGPAEQLYNKLFAKYIAVHEDYYEVIMNKQSTIDKIKVMQAFVDGEEVERYDKGWIGGVNNPQWAWNVNEYRIKPTVCKMTVADISEQLGYEVEVVAG